MKGLIMLYLVLGIAGLIVLASGETMSTSGSVRSDGKHSFGTSSITRDGHTKTIFMEGDENIVMKTTTNRSPMSPAEREELINQWAPLVWFHPSERFYPSSVIYFLQHIKSSEPEKGNSLDLKQEDVPNIRLPPLSEGKSSLDTYLLAPIDPECPTCDFPIFLHGEEPSESHSPKIYAVIHSCVDQISENKTNISQVMDDSANDEDNFPTTDSKIINGKILSQGRNLDDGNHHTTYLEDETQDASFDASRSFAVTYWMFYPYNYGKDVCTINLGFLGRIFVPSFKGVCYGEKIAMANHIGDWERITLQFKDRMPNKLYISAHEFGAYYTYDPEQHIFRYTSQDVRDKRHWSPKYPEVLRLQETHPVVYSALGSHGLWPDSGNHQYRRIPSLVDLTKEGKEWFTWQNLEIIDISNKQQLTPEQRYWVSYEGHWGNPKSKCYLTMLGFCELSDGPVGIPGHRIDFPCHQ